MAADAKHGTYWVREYNKKKLYDLIRRNEGISRAELTRLIDLTPTSVSKIISILIEEGLVCEQGVVSDNKIGRKAIQLRNIPSKVLSLAIKVDVGIVSGAIIDISGKELHSISYELDADISFDAAIDMFVAMITELMGQLDENLRDNVVGVGFAVPGLVDRCNGVVRHAPQLGWIKFPLVKMLREKMELTCPVIIENDIKAEAMAECIFGTASTDASAVILDIGSGLGSAYVSGGRVQAGSHNAMGEIGHILLESNGIKCSCGRYGCLRTHVARTSIEQRTGLKMQACVEAAKNGDTICTDVLNEAVRYTAQWMANIMNLYDPATIYLGGTLLTDWPDFYHRVQTEYRRYIWSRLAEEEPLIKYTYASRSENFLISPASIVFYQFLQTGIQIEAQ